VAQVGTCFTARTGVILPCTYKSLSKGRVFLCKGMGVDALRCISRRILAAPIALSSVSTLNFSMLFWGHDTEIGRAMPSLIFCLALLCREEKEAKRIRAFSGDTHFALFCPHPYSFSFRTFLCGHQVCP
jgi:hypothetical protein